MHANPSEWGVTCSLVCAAWHRLKCAITNTVFGKQVRPIAHETPTRRFTVSFAVANNNDIISSAQQEPPRPMTDTQQPPNEDEEGKPLFQYSLRTLLLVTTAVAVVASLTVTLRSSLWRWLVDGQLPVSEIPLFFATWNLLLIAAWFLGWFGNGRLPRHGPLPLCVRLASPFVFTIVAFCVACGSRGLPFEAEIAMMGLTGLTVLAGVIRQWRLLGTEQRSVTVFAMAFPLVYFALWGVLHSVLAQRNPCFAAVELLPIVVTGSSIPRFFQYGIYGGAVSLLLFLAIMASVIAEPLIRP
jgi:hypothetical protein